MSEERDGPDFMRSIQSALLREADQPVAAGSSSGRRRKAAPEELRSLARSLEHIYDARRNLAHSGGDIAGRRTLQLCVAGYAAATFALLASARGQMGRALLTTEGALVLDCIGISFWRARRARRRGGVPLLLGACHALGGRRVPRPSNPVLRPASSTPAT